MSNTLSTFESVRIKIPDTKPLQGETNNTLNKFNTIDVLMYDPNVKIVVDPAALAIAEKYNRFKNELGTPVGEIVSAYGASGVWAGWRVQNYTKGAIYYSGKDAYAVFGDIYNTYKWLNLHSGQLGFPTHEGFKIANDGRFAHFEHGSIYWSPETKSHVVNHGPIYDKWAKNGWETGFLGYPTTNAGSTPDKIGKYWHFQGGSIYWTPSTGAQIVRKKIRDEWERRSWERGPLGYPLNDTSVSTSNTLKNDFQGGSITWKPSGGYTVKIMSTNEKAINEKYLKYKSVFGEPSGSIKECWGGWWKQLYVKNGKISGAVYLYAGVSPPKTYAVYGGIYEKYASLGAENNHRLGFPTTDETAIGDNIGRFNHFQYGSIYWTQQLGAHIIYSPLKDVWKNLGWETGYLGYPRTDTAVTPDKIGEYNHFQGGSIYRNTEINSVSAYAIREQIMKKWGDLGWEQSRLGYPLSNTEGSPATSLKNKFQGGSISWSRSAGYKVDYPFSKVRLILDQVSCLKQTYDGRFTPDDDIYITGVAFYNNWQESRIPVKKIGSFEDNTSRRNLNMVLCTMPIDTPYWPKGFLASLVLIERDGGNITGNPNQIQNSIINIIQTEAKKKAKELGIAVGTLIGGLIGAPIGSLIGYLGGQIIDKVVSFHDDEVFPAVNCAATADDVFSGFGCGSTTWPIALNVYGHNAKYILIGHWELIK